MKHTTLLILFSLSTLSLTGQTDNLFLDRSFWRMKPDVSHVKKEIANGNDPAELNSNAFDALVYAILENAPLETLQYLLSLPGNEVNKMTHDGRNYYLWAAYKGNVEMMKYCIEQGAKTDLTDDHGYNALTFAANAGQQSTELYELIIAHDVDARSTNRNGANALLLLAPHLKDDALIEYFSDKGLQIDAQDDEGNGMFNYAARMGNIYMMNLCIEMGLDHKSLNKVGGNAMMFASAGSRGHTNTLEVYEYLVQKGVQPNVVTIDGTTPLHKLARSTEDVSVFEFFVEHGVNPDAADSAGNTPFLNAVRAGNTEAIAFFLSHAEDIDHTNEDGYSALTYAVRNSAAETMELLLKNDADMHVVDSDGRNLVYHAFSTFRPDRLHFFDTFMALSDKHGLSANFDFDGGNNLVHLAVDKNSTVLLDVALSEGNDINQRNADGLTPLHLAAMKSHDFNMLKVLIEQGADKTVLTDFDESAYDLAIENELLSQDGTDLEFLKK